MFWKPKEIGKNIEQRSKWGVENLAKVVRIQLVGVWEVFLNVL